MFYALTILAPILILFLTAYCFNIKAISFENTLDLAIKSSPYLYGYSFFLYFLERENYINVDWTFYTIWFFLTPIITLAILIKLFLWIKAHW
jgi:hypothetical protein